MKALRLLFSALLFLGMALPYSGFCKLAVFGNALLAGGDIRLLSNVEIDSYHSGDTNFSFGGSFVGGAYTNGLYLAPLRKANASVASVAGKIDLGEGGILAGSAKVSSTNQVLDGTIGDLNWISAGKLGHQPGCISTNFTVFLPPVTEPPGVSYGWPSGGYVAYTNGSVLKTNYVPVTNALAVFTNYVTSTKRPTNSLPALIQTNFCAWYTNTMYPTNLCQGTSVITNIVQVTTTYRPLSNYLGAIITNCSPQWFTNSTPPTNYCSEYWVVLGSNSAAYAYQPIESYNWDRLTSYSYQVPALYRYPEFISLQKGTNTITAEFTYILDSTPSGYYEMSYLSLSGSEKMLVRGHAVLWVFGRLSMSGQSEIVIGPGASLKLYAGGDIDLSGNGFNTSGNPAALQIYGSDGCTNISIGGNPSLAAYIYAPHATLTFNGGSNVYDVYGAFAASNIVVNGNFRFHYDENATRAGLTAKLLRVLNASTNTIVQQTEPATLTLSVEGTAPIHAHWLFPNSSTPRNTNNSGYEDSLVTSFTLTNAQPEASGTYTVLLSNSLGSLTVPLQLTVTPIPAQFTSMKRVSADTSELGIFISPGRTNILQASSNLVDWVNVFTYLMTTNPVPRVLAPHSQDQQYFRLWSTYPIP